MPTRIEKQAANTKRDHHKQIEMRKKQNVNRRDRNEMKLKVREGLMQHNVSKANT